jgi:hypothetical protein
MFAAVLLAAISTGPAAFAADDEIDKTAACGTKEINFSAKTDKKQHPTPEPEAGQAMVYIVRPGMMGNKVQTKLAMDGEWMGTNRGNTYFYFTADPGERLFCSKAENTSLLRVTFEPGKTYFLQQKIKMGIGKARNELVVMTEEEGREKLGKLNLSVFEEKR